jgi:ribosomal protein S18 acetylase RimI-like enzyme
MIPDMALRVIDRLEPRHIDDLMVLYAHASWSGHRSRDEVVRMLAGTTFVFGLVDDAGRMVGFSRVLTDGVYRGTLFDVIVHPDLRGGGLVKLLLDAVLRHPVVGSLEKLELQCYDDKVKLYEKWGFTLDTLGLRTMNRRVKVSTES